MKNQLMLQLCNIQKANTNQNPKSILEHMKLDFAPSHQFHSTPTDWKKKMYHYLKLSGKIQKY